MLASYLPLIKPRLLLMALFSVLVSFYMASDDLSVLRLFQTLFGAGLIGAGANTLNQYMEKSLDSRMTRTKNRPLPSERLPKKDVLIFGLGLSLSGLLFLSILVNSLSAAMGALTLFSYLFVYTPLKTQTSLNTLAGAVVGALPILIGWAGARGSLDFSALILFLILFLWQMPHFFVIAWIYRQDYKNAGFHMLSRDDATGEKTARHILSYCFILCVVSFVPAFIQMTGLLYLTAAIFSGLFLVGFALHMLLNKLQYAKQFMVASILYLSVLNIFLLLDKAV